MAPWLVASLAAACERGGGPVEPGPEPAVAQVEITVDPGAERAAISPYIYGSNQDHPAAVWTVRRLGGNRLTGYNWENNFSNAGSDWQHSSDRFLLSHAGIPDGEAAIPARVVTHFHDQSRAMGAHSIITLQMAGYVARDASGPVSAAETAPSARWVRVEPRMGAPFAPTPDLDDDAVYMDELVHHLVQRYGGAVAPNGIRWYSLDNEPALWAHTHPRIHPEPVGAQQLVERSIALASAVKAVDPSSEILGPALYGISAYVSLQDAPDWGQLGQGYGWFIDYYLEQMRQAELQTGRRLLDVLDVHWYPEARGDRRITDNEATSPRDVAARLQAPRSLWDPSYREDSWVAQWLGEYLPILPRLQRSIAERYPGTRLAVTEYNYGGGSTISGGLAQADVLGAFGRYGVYIATLWGIEPADVFTAAGFRLFRNYDGQQGAFGSTSVRATTSDAARTSVYAAIHDADASALHVILLNKEHAGPVEMRFRIHGGTAYGSAQLWGFDSSSAQITSRAAVDRITDNRFSYTVPPLTAVHLVLR